VASTHSYEPGAKSPKKSKISSAVTPVDNMPRFIKNVFLETIQTGFKYELTG
jgi:hypothetical protein